MVLRGNGRSLGKRDPFSFFRISPFLDAGYPSPIIIPLTTNLIDNAKPLRIRVKSREKLTRDSELLIDQIRAIDNRRITSGPIANLESELMKRVYQAVLELSGIIFYIERAGARKSLSTPKLTLEGLSGWVVIDEIQRLPSLFEVLRPLIFILGILFFHPAPLSHAQAGGQTS